MASLPPPAVDGRAARWAGQREKRRAEFVDAAIRTITEQGPEAQVGDIASAAGVGRAVLYRHFTDRADLDSAVAERAAEMLVEHLAPVLVTEAATPAAVEAALRRGLAAYLDFISQRLSLYRFVRAHETGNRAVDLVKDTVITRVADVMESMVTSLVGSPAQAKTLATGMVGLAESAIGRWLDDPALPRDELVDLLTRMLLGALAGVVGPLDQIVADYAERSAGASG